MHEHDCNLRAKWTSKQNKWKRKNWSRTAKNVIILLFYYKAHGTRTHSAHFSLPRIVCDMFVRVQAHLLRHCIIISTNFNLRVNRDRTNAEVNYLMHTRKKSDSEWILWKWIFQHLCAPNTFCKMHTHNQKPQKLDFRK